MAKFLILGPEGKRFEYKVDKEKLGIGRENENDLVLSYSSVSRKHATLDKRVFGYYLMDNNSTNGTIVNGEYIREKKLNDRDEIFLGELMMVFFYDDTEYEETIKDDRLGREILAAVEPLPPPPLDRDPKSTIELDVKKMFSQRKDKKNEKDDSAE
jgi:predicted component of type VI protein secretion system